MEEKRNIIIMVDDSSTNLVVGKNTLSGQYDTITLSSCEELFKTLELVSPDLILLDIEMPDMDGYEGLKILKSKPETAHIPVIYLTSHTAPSSELAGLSLGAVDYIRKPFSPPLLLKRIELHLMLEAQKQEIKELTEDLYVIIGERTKDLLDLNRVMRQLLNDSVKDLESVSVNQVMRMREYLSGEIEKIVEEGDPLRFVPKPTAVFKEREQEYKIMLQNILDGN
jgi:putative two-component system response regulator